MSINKVKISAPEVERLIKLEESHFCDVKSKLILPKKLSNTIAAFSNAEGGELYIGLQENKGSGAHTHTWDGFEKIEDANGFIQLFEQLFPLGHGYSYTFLECDNYKGYILKVDISKTEDIKKSSAGDVYIRRGAQNLKILTSEELELLKRNKGITTYENEVVQANVDFIDNSNVVIEFMLDIVPLGEPLPWLKKQQLVFNNKPTVAGIVLFADEPQAILPKRSGVKIYRYNTSENEGGRDNLDEDPISVEGHAYTLIRDALERTKTKIESVRVQADDKLVQVEYPETALHEIITNAVLHRDYSIADDIHIKIFDNRVEVMSPGTLPGHITVENILKERFARNPKIVRLINKFPNPPNKDIGEGLNTAFDEMKKLKLKPPIIIQDGGYVKVVLRHEKLATAEELILKYLETNPNIANKQARDICDIGSENKMKTIIQKMVAMKLIEMVPGRTRYTAAYQLCKKVDLSSHDPKPS